MSINLVTLIAGIFNFLILVILLYFFLFKKIIQVMDKRQKRIEKQLDDAKQTKEEAEHLKAAMEKEKEEMQKKKSELLSKIQSEVEEQKQTLMKKSKEEIEEDKNQLRATLKNQKDLLFTDLRKIVGEAGISVSRQMMKDFADLELQGLVEKSFLQKFQDFCEKRVEELKKIEIGKKVVLSSAFPIKDSTIKEVQSILEKAVQRKIEVETRHFPELILGIEVKMESTKISWNIEDYLNGLQEKADEAFSQFTENK